MARVITPYLLFSVFVITAGPLLFGYHLAELNAPQGVLRCNVNNKSITINLRPCIPMSDSTFGLVTSIFSIGGLFGAISAGFLSDRFGRKGAIMLHCVGFILGPCFMAIAPNVWVLCLGRIISGFSAGSSVVVAPLYIHDVAPTEYAGVFGATTQVTINFGILVAQTLGLFLSTVPYWRLILAIGGMIGLAQLILLPLCVESPKWLSSMNQPARAKRALMKIRGSRNVDDELLILRRGSYAPGADIDDDVSDEQGLLGAGPHVSHKKVTLQEFLTLPEHRGPLIALVGVMVSQQFLGINAIVMYGVSVLGDIIPKSSALINVFISLVNLAVTIVSARFIDSVGRKPLLLASISGMGLFAGFLGIGIIWRIQMLSAVSTLLFVASFAVGLGPVPFMVASEMVEHDAVGAAQSVALTANWLATFAVSFGFPALRAGLGSGNVFFVFTGMGVFFVLFVAKFVPETRGKTVDEVWNKERRVD